MRFSLPKLLIFIVLGILFAYFSRILQGNTKSFEEIPTRLQDFKFRTVEGTTTNYSEVKGRATLVVLSASWCPTCRAELPILKDLYDRYSQQGLSILMISEDENLQDAKKFKDKNSMPWTVGFWDYHLMNLLGNPGVIPVSYLMNSSDSIISVDIGILDMGKISSILNQTLSSSLPVNN